MTTFAWHFTGPTLRDGRPIPPVGERLTVSQPLELCAVGLHGSERLIDALRYAPGNLLHRTKHEGRILYGSDKLCSSARIILWSLDEATVVTILGSFIRSCALDVLHFCHMPALVREYLETGEEVIKAAASAATRPASIDASLAASWAASWSASTARDAGNSHNARLTAMVMAAAPEGAV